MKKLFGVLIGIFLYNIQTARADTPINLPHDSSVTVSKTPDGQLNVEEIHGNIETDTRVTSGYVKGSFYDSAIKAGVDRKIVAEAAKLFSKFDFNNKAHKNDTFRLVFNKKTTDLGMEAAPTNLLYAEVISKGKSTKFYKFSSEYFNELGKGISRFFLHPPLSTIRITSTYGMRFHPVLGYTRMHAGVDLGARAGTPVHAAESGTVEEKKWAGGYGNWLKIDHAGGWSTGYGHLSRYVRGLHVGQYVKQGQVVAYVGATGLATGPHLHYEIMKDDVKLNPETVKTSAKPTKLTGSNLFEFEAQKKWIKSLLNEESHNKKQ